MDTATLVEEVARRGGETEIRGAYGTAMLSAVDERDGLVLLRAAGWRQYSRAYGARRAALAYLCGQDDNGTWAVRVPGGLVTVRDALQWHTPPAVRRAQAAGREVRRQGDVWIVALGPRARRDDARDGRGLPGTHRVVTDARGVRRLVHTAAPGERRHRAVWLPAGPVAFAVGRRLETRRGGSAD